MNNLSLFFIAENIMCVYVYDVRTYIHIYYQFSPMFLCYYSLNRYCEWF